MYRTCETTALTRLDIQRSSTEQCSAPSVIPLYARVSHNEFWTFPTVGVVEQHNLNPLLEPINQGFRHCTTDRTGSLQNGSVSSFWLMVQLCQFQQFMQFIVHAWGITWRYEKDLFRSPKVQKIPEVPRKASLHAPQDGCDGCSAAQSSSLSCANRRSVARSPWICTTMMLRRCTTCYVRRVTYDVLWVPPGCTAPPPVPSVSQASGPRSIASTNRCVASTTSTAWERQRADHADHVDHVKCCQPVRVSEVDQRNIKYRYNQYRQGISMGVSWPSLKKTAG